LIAHAGEELHGKGELHSRRAARDRAGSSIRRRLMTNASIVKEHATDPPNL